MKQQQREFAASAVGREWAQKRQQLPVCQVREQLQDILSRGDCAVLSGDTGCGKTTQVPQYLLEHEIESGRGAACHIICTQPRRIAAISVAERVAQERAEPTPGQPGSRVGCVHHPSPGRGGPCITRSCNLASASVIPATTPAACFPRLPSSTQPRGAPLRCTAPGGGLCAV